MNKLGSLALLGALVSMLSCSRSGGAETGNPASPLQDFAASACKNQDVNEGQQGLRLAPDAEGLQCVEWEREGSNLRIKLHNFPEPCGETYLGAARFESGALELSVYKDTCAIFRCGLCVFDFEFELSDVPVNGPLPVRVGSAVCASEAPDFRDQVTLPLHEQASGVACRALERDALTWYARGRSGYGRRNMPCGVRDMADSTSCEGGLRCSALGANDSRCLVTCSSDDECASGATRCEEGVCRASASW